MTQSKGEGVTSKKKVGAWHHFISSANFELHSVTFGPDLKPFLFLL